MRLAMPWEVMAKNVNVYEIIECFTIWCVYVSERQCAVAKCESDGGYAKRGINHGVGRTGEAVEV